MSSLGGSDLQRLQSIASRLDEAVDPSSLVQLLSFSDPNDSWISQEATDLASVLLAKFKVHLQSQDFIVNYILTDFIRPLFAEYKPAAVTTQGRKAQNPSILKQRGSELNPRPWTSHDSSAVSSFRWAVVYADYDTIQRSWHLFVPPLLTLLDDSSTDVRSRGLEILIVLLKKTPVKILRQTGLVEVFEEAVMPTLLFLPSLTPADESVRLLRPAYSALFTLAEVCFPTSEEEPKKIRLFDRIMRHGILQGFLHSRDDVKIVEVLLEELTALVQFMGIYATKHLKDTIPIVSNILCDPFGISRPPLLLAAVQATKSMVLTSWPRITADIYRLELVKALSLCWATVREEYSAESEKHHVQLEILKQELKTAGKLLVRAVGNELDFGAELQPLIQLDPSLKEVFM